YWSSSLSRSCPSEDEPSYIFKNRREMPTKGGSRGAVDHAMIVRKTQRQHQPRNEAFAIPHRRHFGAYDTEDCDLWRIDDWREGATANPTERRNRECRTLHLRGRQFAVARFCRDGAEFTTDLDDALAVNLLDDRDDQAFRRIDRDADVVEFLVNESVFLRCERGVEVRKRLQCIDRCLHQEWQKRNAVRFFLVGLAGIVEFLAILLDLRNIRLVIMGDVRNVEPRAMEKRSRNPLDPHHRLDLDRAELREVDGRNFGDTHAAHRCAGGRAPSSAT